MKKMHGTPTLKPLSVIQVGSIYFFAFGMPNLIAVQILSLFLSHLIRTPADQEIVLQTLKGSTAVTIATFLIPILVSGFYLYPIGKACITKTSSDLARRRILNAPLILSLIGMSGWLMECLYFTYSFYQHYASVFTHSVLTFNLSQIITGSLVFVITYYLVEFINRQEFIPRFFPKGDLSTAPGTIHLSISARFYIYFFAVSIFPLILFYSIILAQFESELYNTLILQFGLIAIALIVVGAWLTRLVARSYQTPLVAMQQAAAQIQAGNYDQHITVISNDEIGNLGEGLNATAASLREKELIKDTFGRLVDPRVRDYVLAGHLELGGEIRTATILMCDIRGFTTLSEKMRPDQIVAWLNRYLDAMSSCITAEGGLVNKYIGDAILAVFGVPITDPDHAAAAVRAAQRIRKARLILNAELTAADLPAIHNGIGIHTGPVLAGNIGSSSRMEYTVIGDAVNLTSRIESLCKELQHDLLISESTVANLPEEFQPRYLETVTVRGKEQPIRLFTLS